MGIHDIAPEGVRGMSAQSQANPSVSFTESAKLVHTKVREFLKAAVPPNFVVVSRYDDTVNIEVPVPRKKRFLAWTYAGKGKDGVGELRFSADRKIPREEAGKRWLLLVYGRDNVELFMAVAQRLVDEFKVGVHVRLENETPLIVN
jgi:hypothetical protein